MTTEMSEDELDALAADLAAWQKNSDATFIEAGGNPADRKEEGWDTAQEAIDAITALRARVAELERDLADTETDRQTCRDLLNAEINRAESAESQLQQVKADAERLRRACANALDMLEEEYGEVDEDNLYWATERIKEIKAAIDAARSNDGTA